MKRICTLLFGLLVVAVLSHCQSIPKKFPKNRFGTVTCEGPVKGTEADGKWKCTHNMFGYSFFDHRVNGEIIKTYNDLFYENGDKHTECQPIDNGLFSCKAWDGKGRLFREYTKKPTPKEGAFTILEETAYLERAVFPDGSVSQEGKIIDGRREGLWVDYYINGNVFMKIHYKNGIMRGREDTFAHNGLKLGEAIYREGVLFGPSELVHPNGKIRGKGNYENGKRIGTWIFYDPDGKVVEEKEF